MLASTFYDLLLTRLSSRSLCCLEWHSPCPVTHATVHGSSRVLFYKFTPSSTMELSHLLHQLETSLQGHWNGVLLHWKGPEVKADHIFFRFRGKEDQLPNSSIFCIIANACNIDHFNMLLFSFHLPAVSWLPAHSDLKVSNKYHFNSANVFWPTQYRRRERKKRRGRGGELLSLQDGSSNMPMKDANLLVRFTRNHRSKITQEINTAQYSPLQQPIHQGLAEMLYLCFCMH